MEITACTKLDSYSVLGSTLWVYFNERYIEATEETNARWMYTAYKCPVGTARDTVIEGVIATKYPTYGTELAALHKGGAALDEYMQFRNFAKTTVDKLPNYLIGD